MLEQVLLPGNKGYFININKTFLNKRVRKLNEALNLKVSRWFKLTVDQANYPRSLRNQRTWCTSWGYRPSYGYLKYNCFKWKYLMSSAQGGSGISRVCSRDSIAIPDISTTQTLNKNVCENYFVILPSTFDGCEFRLDVRSKANRRFECSSGFERFADYSTYERCKRGIRGKFYKNFISYILLENLQ